MKKLQWLIWKEAVLLSRDIHGLALLFIMPIIFILVMTFALQNQYSSTSSIQLNYYFYDYSETVASARIKKFLEKQKHLLRLPATDLENARNLAKIDKAHFIIIIPDDFLQPPNNRSKVTLEVSPATQATVTEAMRGQLQYISQRLYLEDVLQETLISKSPDIEEIAEVDTVNVVSLTGNPAQRPSSVQQNVPAWLLFAMFFIAIPLSTTYLNERQQGTLLRLNTMNVPYQLIYFGKLLPYLLITQLQIMAMLLLGVYVVPLLGGEALDIGNSPAGLILISFSASLAAVSYALLIAQLAKTIEQATIITGISNILMAAIGGVMVPRFVMPEAMQELSIISPMSWGLEGFLDIFLRGGGVLEIFPEAIALIGFALLMSAGATALPLLSKQSLRCRH